MAYIRIIYCLHKKKNYPDQFSEESLFIETFKSSESSLKHPGKISNNPDIWMKNEKL